MTLVLSTPGPMVHNDIRNLHRPFTFAYADGPEAIERVLEEQSNLPGHIALVGSTQALSTAVAMGVNGKVLLAREQVLLRFVAVELLRATRMVGNLGVDTDRRSSSVPLDDAFIRGESLLCGRLSRSWVGW